MKNLVLMPSLQNVVAGSTATLNCPVGKTYERFVLSYAGTNMTQANLQMLKNIQLIINGKTVMTWATAADIESINKFYGRQANAGQLVIYLNRTELADPAQNRITGLGTSDVKTLSLTMDLDAALAGAVAPTITASAILSEPQPLGLFCKLKKFVFNSSVTGQIEIADLPRGPRIMAVHLLKATAGVTDISDIEFEIDSLKIVKGSRQVIEELQKEQGFVPQSAVGTSWSFNVDKDIFQALVTETAKDMRIRPTLLNAGAITAYVEYLDGFAGL